MVLFYFSSQSRPISAVLDLVNSGFFIDEYGQEFDSIYSAGRLEFEGLFRAIWGMEMVQLKDEIRITGQNYILFAPNVIFNVISSADCKDFWRAWFLVTWLNKVCCYRFDGVIKFSYYSRHSRQLCYDI